MKLLYGKKASDAERRGVTNVIHCNIIQSMQIMLGQIDCLQKDNATTVESESSDSTIDSTADQARTSFSIRLNDKDCRSAANKIRELRMYDKLTPALAQDLKLLWNSKAVQQMYELRHTYQLPDSTNFYMSKLNEITAPDYLPSDEDMLRSRVRTSGIVEEKYVIDGVKFSMYDVGGQRNERKKWIHCFEDVTAIIFCVAMSEYDQVLHEDETTVSKIYLEIYNRIKDNRSYLL
jgi:hypothetical protein